MYRSIVLTVFAVCSISFVSARPGGSHCVPPVRQFHWESPCPKSDHFDRKILINRVDALQGSPLVSVDRLGGINLGKPLTMRINFTLNYGKPINDHRFDFKMYKYDDEGRGCEWIYQDTYGATDDVNACNMIKNDCEYRLKPKLGVEFTVDWSEASDQFNEILKPGSYYGFQIVERDGDKARLNCLWLYSKIIGVGPKDQ